MSKLSPKQEAVLDFIKEDAAYENYFFGKVSDPAFFFALKKKGYFSAENAPSAQPADEEGYFKIPEWNVLPYLERLSRWVKSPRDDNYIDGLLTVIEEVSRKRTDNYRTWWHFVKILLNIPNERIPLRIIGLIPIWLESRFDTGLQGAEIAEKLLRKFLGEDPSAEDIDKAEKIIESITTIKNLPAPKEKTVLTERRATTFLDAYWLVQAFEKYSQDIGRKCSDKVIRDLAEKQRCFLENDKSQIFLEIDERRYLLVLEEKDANFLVQVLSVDQQTEDATREALLLNKKISGQVILEFAVKKCDRYDFERIMFEHFSESAVFHGANDALLRRKIRNLHRNLFSSGTYESFYAETNLRGALSPEETLTFGLKSILDAKAKHNEQETRNILKQFLEDDYVYFPKLALYVVGRNIDRYADLFWDLVDSKHAIFIFEASFFGDELKHLLKNLRALSDEQKKKIESVIEQGPTYFVPDEEADRYMLLWKQRRYHALSSDPHFEKLYRQLRNITEQEAELAPALGPTVTRWGPGPSPLTKEQLLEMSNRELAEFLAIFEPTSSWDGPTVRALSDVLKAVVRESPNKFTADLSPFLNSGYLYVYDLLHGARDAWNAEKPIEWGTLMDFVERYANQKEFGTDVLKTKGDDWNADHRWVVGAIGELIQVGTRNDSWAFAEQYLPMAERILISICDKLEVEKERVIDDTVTDALNSATGKVITALIFIALRTARLQAKKDIKVKLPEAIKGRYERLLKDGAAEAYTLFGQYMPNLAYLDKTWVEQKIHEFEEMQERELWSAFMDGYLFRGTVDDDLYNLMRNHYLEAMQSDFKEEHSNTRLIQHIALQYLKGVEDLSKNGLFTLLVNDWKPSVIREIIGFFWSQRDVLIQDKANSEAQIQKIIAFWRQMYAHYTVKEELAEDEKRILSNSSKLAIFLPEISEEGVEWLKLSAPYVHDDYDSPFFIEYLNNLKDRGDRVASARYVGEVFLKILETFLPDYDKRHIMSIVEYLFSTGDEEVISSAEKICNVYARQGSDFLREIYDRNRN